jgi:hypothetical protein
VLSTLAHAVLSGPTDAATPLLAYLDPGSGSMALQVLIAGMLSSLYFLRSSMTQIKGWVAAHRPGR